MVIKRKFSEHYHIMPNRTKNQLNNYFTFLKKQPKGFVYVENELPIKTPDTPCSKQPRLDELKKQCHNCQACPLASQGRSQVVFGRGWAEAQLMFIGEGPGRDEDRLGKPFVGRAGQLLSKIIAAMELDEDNVYITNVVKCRPPNNRAPLPQESGTCKDLLLFKEIDIIQPKVICALGSTAIKALLGDHLAISKVRGQFLDFRGYPLLPTYHPAYLLRNPAEKRTVWEDMKKVLAKLAE